MKPLWEFFLGPMLVALLLLFIAYVASALTGRPAQSYMSAMALFGVVDCTLRVIRLEQRAKEKKHVQ